MMQTGSHALFPGDKEEEEQAGGETGNGQRETTGSDDNATPAEVTAGQWAATTLALNWLFEVDELKTHI